MARIEDGVLGTTVATVDATRKALRVSLYPQEVGVQGAYACALQGGNTAGALTDGEIYQFRWTDSTRLAVVERVDLLGVVVTTAFGANAVGYIDMVVARSWTVDGSGGQVAVLTGDFNNLQVGHAASLLNVFRGSTGAALGAGTKTLDGGASVGFQGINGVAFGIPTAAVGATLVGSTCLFGAQAVDTPLVLSTNEGFVVRATWPATGVVTHALAVQWREVLATAY